MIKSTMAMFGFQRCRAPSPLPRWWDIKHFTPKEENNRSAVWVLVVVVVLRGASHGSSAVWCYGVVVELSAVGIFHRMMDFA